MKCWGSMLWYAAAVLLLVEVCAKKMPKYCKRLKRPSKTKTDYCSVASCAGQANIGCKNDMKFITGCVGNMFNISTATRNFIVRQHNTYRNIVARGKLHDLPPSGRMLKMQWHEELAELARFAAYRCSIGKVFRCFATMEYAGAGYNTAYNKFPGEQDYMKIVRAQMKTWYEQYQYSNAKSIMTGKAPGGQEIGHFLQIVSGLSDRIGCAIFRSRHFGYNYQVLICAYSCSKPTKVPVYKLSRIPAEHCTCGSDHDHKNLCSAFERVSSCEAEPPKSLAHDMTVMGLDYESTWNGDKKAVNTSNPVQNVANFIEGQAA